MLRIGSLGFRAPVRLGSGLRPGTSGFEGFGLQGEVFRRWRVIRQIYQRHILTYWEKNIFPQYVSRCSCCASEGALQPFFQTWQFPCSLRPLLDIVASREACPRSRHLKSGQNLNPKTRHKTCL